MPWTLYRYILWEIIKLLVLITSVLMMVISFGSAIKPMSEGLLSSGALTKFIILSAPTMLGFALPFAAALASTLVFIRMAADNEVLACSASGMSYRSILMPVFLLGLVLTMGLFGLSNFVIPHFYRAVERTVTNDVLTVLVNQLNNGEPVALEDLVIYADRAEPRTLSREEAAQIRSPVPPVRLIRLEGVAAAQRDDQGRMSSDITARRANLLLFRDPQTQQSWVTIRLRDLRYRDTVRHYLAFSQLYDVPPMRIPNPFQDDVEFLSWPQLRALKRHPDRYQDIQRVKDTLWREAAAHRVRQAILDHEQGLRSPSRSLELVDVQGRYTYRLIAPALEAEGDGIRLRAAADRPVIVEQYADDGPVRRFEVQTATLRVSPPEAGLQPNVEVQLTGAQVYEPGAGSDPVTEHPELTLQRMVWPGQAMERGVSEMSVSDLFHLADSFEGDRPRATKVANTTRYLWSRLTRLHNQILAQVHLRAASAVSCLLLLLLGAVLSLLLKGQMPLVVYLWSFLLAMGTILLMHTGENMASGAGLPLWVALGVVWLGNVALAAAAGWAYCRVARN